MTTINASNMVAVADLFPTVKTQLTADANDTNPLTTRQTVLEDAASDAQGIAQMLADAFSSGGGVNIFV